MITSRQYQQEAVDSLFDYWRESKGNPIIVAPTGSGKSIIIGIFCRQALALYPSTRILIATHVQELVWQDSQAIEKCGVETGIYSAGLKRRDRGEAITVASVQSIYKRVFDFRPFDLLLIDECHLVNEKQTGMYQTLIKNLLLLNPRLKVAGFTATPYRMTSGLLTDGDMFDDICYEITIAELLRLGHLSPLTTKGGKKKVKLKDVRVVRGDYSVQDLERAMRRESVTKIALREAIERGRDRKSWIVFCVTVALADEAKEILREEGIEAELIHGGTPKAERVRMIERFKKGKIRALTSVGVLTTGFDAPFVDMIVMLRPTKSAGLYTQMLGRGMRVAEGKKDCLVLDFAHNIEEHGPVDKIRIRRKKKKEGGGQEIKKVACKECPKCNSFVPTRLRECPDCGYLFPMAPEHDEEASELEVLSQTEKLKIRGKIQYNEHISKKGSKSMRVTYYVGLDRVSEWICFEHTGYARMKAVRWWKRRSNEPVPRKVEDALKRTGELREPIALIVGWEGKYRRIEGYVWEE